MNKSSFISNQVVFYKDLELPGSKSLSQRFLILSALKGGETLLKNFLISEDTQVISEILTLFGFQFIYSKKDLLIKGPSFNQLIKKKYKLHLNFKNSGASLRFFFSFLALLKGEFSLQSSVQLEKRPIEFIVQEMMEKGFFFLFEKEIFSLPLSFFSNQEFLKKKQELKITIQKTSQWLSGLLLVFPYFQRESEIQIDQKNFPSESYVRMTERIVKKFSSAEFYIHQRNHKRIYKLIKPGLYSFDEYFIEPDLTHSSYFLNIIAILGGHLEIKNINKNSLQEDIFYFKLIEKLGCQVHFNLNTVSIDGPIFYHEDLIVDMKNHIDLVPSLAVLALFLKKKTKMQNIKNLIYKESNRLEALVKELSFIGASINTNEEFLEITPKALSLYRKKGQLKTYQDHRLVMAFSLINCIFPDIEIENKEAVEKSYPDFFKTLKMIFKKKAD